LVIVSVGFLSVGVFWEDFTYYYMYFNDDHEKCIYENATPFAVCREPNPCSTALFCSFFATSRLEIEKTTVHAFLHDRDLPANDAVAADIFSITNSWPAPRDSTTDAKHQKRVQLSFPCLS
jgi:hypothetical protein